MKTKTIKLTCLQIAFLFVSCGLQAQQQVSLTEAKNAAVKVVNRYLKDSNLNTQDISVINYKTDNKDTLMYEVIFKNGQSVLLSGSKACLPILAVLDRTSKVHSLLNPVDDLPEGVIDLLETYIQQIHYCFQNDTIKLHYQDEWKRMQNMDNTGVARAIVVPPLLSTMWGQSTSNNGNDANAYNFFAPQLCGTNNCKAGCVAVAMAQIMNYWKYPVYGPLGWFDWCNMPDKLEVYNYNNYQWNINYNYEKERNAIASLIKDCGIAVNMNYCGSVNCGSGALSSDALTALVNRYGYSSNAVYQYRASYNDNTWIVLMKNNLNQGWPILYGGYGRSGHAFVCDGYESDDNDVLFHFNFGWNGSYNGYYTIDALNPGIYNYNDQQDAIFSIYPGGTQDYCNFTLPLETHYTLIYILNNNPLEPYANVPKTLTRLISVPDNMNYPTTWYTIPNGATAEYVAHEEIILQSGFYAAEGSDFYAHIEPCPSCSGRNAPQSMAAGNSLLPIGYADMPSQRESSETGITEPNFKQSLKLWPNPVSGMLHIQLPDAEKEVARITVCDLLGRVVLQKENLPKPEIEVSSLPNGMYLLQLQLSDGTNLTAKFVKD